MNLTRILQSERKRWSSSRVQRMPPQRIAVYLGSSTGVSAPEESIHA